MSTLDDLVALSTHLGDPARDLAILAEGNTSARIDDGTFWVKASGHRLEQADEPQAFVSVRMAPLVDALRRPGGLDDAEAGRALRDAVVEGSDGAAPSIETFVHAVCIAVGEASFVAHTHPTAVNALLCSGRAVEAYGGVLFPDEAVVCGPAPLLVPYAAPGHALGRVLLERLEEHIAVRGAPPRVVLLLNHGLVALGQSADDAAAITAMAVKAARIRLGALATGAVRFLPDGAAETLYGRDDERERRERLARR